MKRTFITLGASLVVASAMMMGLTACGGSTSSGTGNTASSSSTGDELTIPTWYSVAEDGKSLTITLTNPEDGGWTDIVTNEKALTDQADNESDSSSTDPAANTSGEESNDTWTATYVPAKNSSGESTTIAVSCYGQAEDAPYTYVSLRAEIGDDGTITVSSAYRGDSLASVDELNGNGCTASLPNTDKAKWSYTISDESLVTVPTSGDIASYSEDDDTSGTWMANIKPVDGATGDVTIDFTQTKKSETISTASVNLHINADGSIIITSITPQTEAE